MSSKIFLAYEYSDLHLFINNHSSPAAPAGDVFFLPKFHFITFKVKLVVPRFVPISDTTCFNSRNTVCQTLKQGVPTICTIRREYLETAV